MLYIDYEIIKMDGPCPKVLVVSTTKKLPLLLQRHDAGVAPAGLSHWCTMSTGSGESVPRSWRYL